MNQGIFALSSRGIGSPLPLLGLPGRSVSVCGWPGTHPEALGWRARVLANNGNVSENSLSAISDFCRTVDQFGMRNKFYRLNLFAGDSLNSALVPLYTGPVFDDTVYGAATEINTVIPFAASDYSESVGITAANATTKYLDSGFSTSLLTTAEMATLHLSAWHSQTGAGQTDPVLLGVNFATTDRFALQLSIRTTTVSSDSARSGKTTSVASTTWANGARPSAFVMAQRTSPISLEFYRNGLIDGVNTTSTTGIAAVSFPITIFRLNNSGTIIGDAPGLSLRHYSIGQAMSATQVAAFHDALRTFNASMGRTA